MGPRGETAVILDDARRVYLVGFMGSGKSVVGRSLADRSGWEHLDTDREVEASERRSIETIFRDSGEGAFREAEWRVLTVAAKRPCVVVSTGGGAYSGLEHRRLMAATGITVWLDVDLDVAAARIAAEGGRPLWNGDDRLALRAFFEKRRAAYALARVRLEVGGETPDAIADRILERIPVIHR